MGQAEEVRKVEGALGVHTSYGWERDPKRLGFTAARYKFVAKMFEGKGSVLEVGCGDAFFSRVVAQHVKRLVAVDRELAYVGSAMDNSGGRFTVQRWDILGGPVVGFDAVYCLDVFEHIPKSQEDLLLANLKGCAPVCVVGCPSEESQRYASEVSKLEHVNCPTKESLRASMQRHFGQVFMFGMSDEVLHTGMMAPYLFALGVNASQT